MAFTNRSRIFGRGIVGYLREVDLPLLVAVVAILFVSALNVYGITGGESTFFTKQVLFSIIGLALMVAASFFNHRYLKNYSLPVLTLYVVAIGLLVFALAFHPVRGSRAWIAIGNFTLEPSEVMKLAFIALMAKYFSQRHIHIRQLRHIIVSGAYLAIPLGIILLQPDLGSGVLLMLIWGGMLVAAGIDRRHLLALLLLAVAGAYLSWAFALKPYQKERLVAFVDPYQDPTGIGYNVIQSKIALGSGRWFGKGLGEGTQATLGFLPEAHNDFAFAAFAEQFGWVGTATLLGLIALVVLRILAIGRRATHNFGKLFCVGLAIMILVHVFVNAAVNVGILPITGIPFSFLSYGGSHLLVLMIGIGIVQSIHRYR